MAKRGLFVSLPTVLSLIVFAGAAGADATSPAVEVKFFLEPGHVLNSDFRPNDELLNAFHLSKRKEPVMLRMQFLDSRHQELHQEGWNIRFRKVQGEDHIELTFKRRYPVQDSLEPVFAKAAQEGFGAASGSQYQSEVEWGYSRQTLSFGKEKDAGSAEPQTLTLPSAEDAQLLAQEKLPDNLQHWKRKGWAKRILFDACLYGPVDGWRWYGKHEEIDDKIIIEVWKLPSADKSGNEHIVVTVSSDIVLDAFSLFTF